MASRTANRGPGCQGVDLATVIECAQRSGAAALLVLIVCCGCVGYRMGNRDLFPDDIRTVYVPVFESASFRRNLGERLTEAVCKEIENRTPYKVVADPGADSILAGRITGENKKVLIRSKTGDPRETQVNLVVQVSWIDRQGRMLRQAQEFPVPPELTEVGGSASLIPELGHSVATAQQQAIQRLAQQIVGLMESPW
jgi:hypothetical protein